LVLKYGLPFLQTRHGCRCYQNCVLPSLTRTMPEFSYFLVIGRAPGHNAPLSPFLISALFILFACLYCMVPHLSFFALFPYLSPPLLIFSLRIDPLHFLAGCRKRRLNLAVVLCLFWGLSAGYQPRPQVVDRGTTARYGGQLRYI